MTRPPDDETIQSVTLEIQKSRRYRQVHPDLVRILAAAELAKGRSPKEAVKAARTKLHQAGGAYLEDEPPFDLFHQQLATLPADRFDPAVKEFALDCMRWHASTRERLPILEQFYRDIIQPLGPLHSVLDLACGMNPLALAWLPLAPNAVVYACDIYQDLLGFISAFFAHVGQPGEVNLHDLTASTPQKPVQLALLLKAIPCLEQLDKSIGRRLLDEIQAEHLVVTFPAHSLGGRHKGMPQFYENHFMEIAGGLSWNIHKTLLPGELVFLLSR